MLRSVLGIIGGLMAGFWLILGVEKLGNRFYPPPPGLDLSKPEVVIEFMKSHPTPTGLLVFVLLAWAVGTFVGAGIAARIAGVAKIRHGMVIGVLFLLASLNQMSMFPHPTWFWIAGVVEFLPVAYLGARLVTLAPTEKPEGFEE
jgi:hypothetical protein